MTVMKYDEAWSWAAPAGEDLTGDLNKFVKMNSDGELVLCGNGEAALGTLYEEAVENADATVIFGAVGKVICGGDVTAGSRVQSDGSGLAVTLGGGIPLGIALASGSADTVIPIAFIGR